MKALFWFRQDLRLNDNPLLVEAAEHSDDLHLVYVLDEATPHPLGAAQRWWLHHSLTALMQALKQHKVTLTLLKGDAQQHIANYAADNDIETVYWNRLYTPFEMQRDHELAEHLREQSLEVKTANRCLLTEPGIIENNSGEPYKVFTPYSKAAFAQIETVTLAEPPKLKQKTSVKGDTLNSWRLLPTAPDWSTGFTIWQPGETGAHLQLEDFLEEAMADYAEQRDVPGVASTSRLSPYLHFGELSPHQVWFAVQQQLHANAACQKGAQAYLRQLIWREFSYYLLFHFPTLPSENFKPEFDQFKWENNTAHLKQWQQGQTGYPIVDAGMRELWHTGYMHNRVRMITASFLIKDLLIDWRAGEAWFWDTLLDADLANNSAGWQWVAGSGADAAPYFRVFNPTLQGEKFDKTGQYVRQWVPELRELPDRYLHCPFDAPDAVLKEANIELGKDYPEPIVDHKTARERALSRYQETR